MISFLLSLLSYNFSGDHCYNFPIKHHINTNVPTFYINGTYTKPCRKAMVVGFFSVYDCVSLLNAMMSNLL